MRVEFEFGMEIQNKLPFSRSNAAHWIDVHVPIGTVSRENAVSMFVGIAPEDIKERTSVQRCRGRATGRFDQGREDIDSTNHGIRAGAGLHLAWPGDQ